MKWRTILKAAVLATSIVLAAVFVSYRAGAFSRFLDQSAENPPTHIYSSKVGEIMPPSTETTVKKADAAQSPAFMGSSKSIILTEPKKDAAPQPPAKPPPTFLPSSKSATLIDPLIKPDPPKQSGDPKK